MKIVVVDGGGVDDDDGAVLCPFIYRGLELTTLKCLVFFFPIFDRTAFGICLSSFDYKLACE